jgi:tetratricopeptide (TPR) repeat protein
VRRVSAKLWTAALVFLVGAAIMGSPCHPVLAQQSNTTSGQSWYTPITSGVKSGFNKIGKAFDPKSSSKTPAAEDDAISLKSKANPSPELYVAIGEMCVESGKLADAEVQYQTALNMVHDHLGALLAYARLKEQLGKKDEALWLYQRAAKTHPKEPAVHNNMGLFYARQGQLDEAVAAMTLAIQMAPKSPLYRNNIATVLVDQCRFREAFVHLRDVHGEAAAYYNLGYLLNKKGKTQAAMQHFAMALRADPSLVVAQRWIDYLQKQTTQAKLPHHPSASGIRITTEKNRWADVPPEPVETDSSPKKAERGPISIAATPERDTSSIVPDAVRPRRLPPVPSDQSDSSGPSLPGFSCDRSEGRAIPSAPLPPPSTNSAVRRLPQVE